MPDLSRRRLLGGLILGPASITPTMTVRSQGAFEFLNPMCPTCCAVFDVTALIPLRPGESYGERAARGTTPVDVTCQCGWQGQLTFFRRQ